MLDTNLIEIIALISTMLAIYWGFINATRDKKAETKEEAVTLATIVHELEAVQTKINELKFEVREEMRKPINEHSERLLKLEIYNQKFDEALIEIADEFKQIHTSIKRVHDRIDILADKNNTLNLNK